MLKKIYLGVLVAVVAGLLILLFEKTFFQESKSPTISMPQAEINGDQINVVGNSNQITIRKGLSEEALRIIFNDHEHLIQLQKKRGISEAVIMEFFKHLGENDVPPYEYEGRLLQFADDYISLEQRLSELSITSEEVRHIASEARQAMDSANLEKARKLIIEATTNQIRRHDILPSDLSQTDDDNYSVEGDKHVRKNIPQKSSNLNCQIIIGIDLSNSAPWSTNPDDLDFAIKIVSEIASNSAKKGDKVIIVTLTAFTDRNSLNSLLQTHEVRRDKGNSVRIEKKIRTAIAGASKKQANSSILGFLFNLPRLYPGIPIGRIVLLTDGFEHSEFGMPNDFAHGNRELPVLRPNYLEGVHLVFAGFGNTLDRHTQNTVAGLESAWNKHCENAGAQCEFINW
jgi:hypothetical protein